MTDGDDRAGGASMNGGDRDAGGAADDVEARLAALAAERDETKDRLLRVAAEFENWKKRARKEQSEAEGKARESVLKEMLEVLDNLERAVASYGDRANGAVDGAAVLKGVALVQRLFQTKLERYDVKPIAAVGQPFDPRQHEAVSRVETASVPPGAVAAELQRGYRIGDRLLRPSLVSVAIAPSETPGGAQGGSA